MSVNGVTSTQAADTWQAYKNGTRKESSTDSSKTQTENNGVVYEPSKDKAQKAPAKTYKPDTALVNKLKAETEARNSQLQSLVRQMISKQGDSYGKATDIWQFLSGGKYKVDAATKAQAQAEIAEDGYWGVNQTSDRIIDFATALTGGNPDKIEEMRSAFKKGFDAAAKKWGGNLPDISQRTYDAVMKKFDDLKAGTGEPADTE